VTAAEDLERGFAACGGTYGPDMVRLPVVTLRFPITPRHGDDPDQISRRANNPHQQIESRSRGWIRPAMVPAPPAWLPRPHHAALHSTATLPAALQNVHASWANEGETAARRPSEALRLRGGARIVVLSTYPGGKRRKTIPLLLRAFVYVPLRSPHACLS
jgi:hypothetical protein